MGLEYPPPPKKRSVIPLRIYRPAAFEGLEEYAKRCAWINWLSGISQCVNGDCRFVIYSFNVQLSVCNHFISFCLELINLTQRFRIVTYVIHSLLIRFRVLLGAFAKLRKAIVGFVMSVRPSASWGISIQSTCSCLIFYRHRLGSSDHMIVFASCHQRSHVSFAKESVVAESRQREMWGQGLWCVRLRQVLGSAACIFLDLFARCVGVEPTGWAWRVTC